MAVEIDRGITIENDNIIFYIHYTLYIVYILEVIQRLNYENFNVQCVFSSELKILRASNVKKYKLSSAK